MEQAEAQVQGERSPLEQDRSITSSDERLLTVWSPLSALVVTKLTAEHVA